MLCTFSYGHLFLVTRRQYKFRSNLWLTWHLRGFKSSYWLYTMYTNSITILFDQILVQQRRILACTVEFHPLVFCDFVFLSNGKVYNFPNYINRTCFFSFLRTVLTLFPRNLRRKWNVYSYEWHCVIKSIPEEYSFNINHCSKCIHLHKFFQFFHLWTLIGQNSLNSSTSQY